MTIHLTEVCEQFVRSLVQGGQYGSEDEVIAAALRLLHEREEQSRPAEDRARTLRSVNEADAGLGRPVSEMLAEMKQILAGTRGR